MKTDDLIDMLASAAFMLAVLGLRSDLGQAQMLPAFWGKLGLSAALAWAGWLAAKRLSVPGARTAWLPPLLAAPLLLIWCVAGMTLLRAAPEARAALFWGDTWRACPLLIALMSLPLFLAALHVMRARAPTRLRLAGAAAGLASGAAAATVYCLHCPEMSMVFVGFWYVLGMLIPATLGSLIGPRVLAW